MIEDPQILFRYMDQGFFPTNSIWETQMEGLRWNLTDAPPPLICLFCDILARVPSSIWTRFSLFRPSHDPKNGFFVIFSPVLLTIFRRLQHISCLQNPKLQVPSTNLNRNEHTHRKLLTRKVLALHISFMYGLLQILYFSARVASELVTKNEDPQDNM